MSTSAAPISIGIIADDLTSAADGAGPFVERGLRTKVGRRHVPSSHDVLSIDCASRSMSETDAGSAVSRSAASLRERTVLYKTIDSTLRGHGRAEIAAALDASGRSRLFLAPAFPDAGRTTVDGVQLVHGVPVDRTDYANDPVHPVRSASLRDLVDPSIEAPMIIDASTQVELDDAVADFMERFGWDDTLWVGSPGLARALASNVQSVPAPTVRLDPIGAALVAVGTANAVSHEQARQLRPNDAVTLLTAPEEREADSAAVLSRLAERAADELRSGRYATLIATGGDMLEAILDTLGVHEFDLLGEVEPGFPVGRTHVAGIGSLTLSMKAGGFGDPGTLARAVDRLVRAPMKEPT